MSEPQKAPGVAARALIGAVALYRVTLSPLLHLLGVRCRYLPTCSAYADEALARHGALKGAVLAVSRLCRCHPFGGSGFDPVPPALPAAGWRIWRYGDWSWRARGRPPA